MSLGMRMEMNQSQQQEQSLSLAQSLELRQKLTQIMAGDIRELRSEGDDDPAKLIDDVISKTLEGIENPQTREAIKQIFSDESFKKEILQQAISLAVPKELRVASFVVDYVYRSSTDKGEFVHYRTKDDPIGPKTPLRHFSTAYKLPDTLKQEIKQQEDIMKTMGGGTEGGLQELREMRSALTIMEAIRPYIETLATTLGYMLVKKDAQGEALFGNFVRDLAILEKLDVIESSRMQKRFYNRFKKVKERSSASEYQDAMLNTVGEYTLITMGVVSPSVFVLNRAEIDEKEYDLIREECKSKGVDFDAILAHYKLQSSGTLFWNRYHTLEKLPTQVTDNKIREFITSIVREDKKEILEALGFERALFPQIKEAKHLETDDEIENTLRELLTDALTNEKFKQVFIKLLRKWYPHLAIFYRG